MNTAQVIPFKFEAREVRTLLIDGQPWFVATDVASALCYRDAFNMCRNLDDDEKGTQIVSTPKQDGKGVHILHTLSGEQEMLVINESGLYSAILRSRKAEAKRFKKWVTAEVLPAIRKHGHYTDSQNKMTTLVGETIGTNGFNMLGGLIKGKVVRLPVNMRRRATAKLWSQTHTAFGVRSAADIPADQLDAARNFIAAYALEGEWLPKQEPTGVVVLDVYAAQHVYLLMSRFATMNKHRESLGAAAQALGSNDLMSVYSQIREGRASFGHLDASIGNEIYNAYRSLSVNDGGYAIGAS